MRSGVVPSDKPRITLYLSEELKKAIEIWAERESRSVSAQIGHLMNQWLVEKSALVIEPPEELMKKLNEKAKSHGMPIETLVLTILFDASKDER